MKTKLIFSMLLLFVGVSMQAQSCLPLVVGRHARSHSICDLGHQ